MRIVKRIKANGISFSMTLRGPLSSARALHEDGITARHEHGVRSRHAKITALVGFDISAAFDTIDHDVLASHLESQFGVVGAASSWLRSYLHGRQQFVRLGRHSSPMTQCDCCVPQGSVLGPLLLAS